MKELAPTTPYAEIARLVNRPRMSVNVKIYKMGWSGRSTWDRRKDGWTVEEIQFLRDTAAMMSHADIGASLGRTRDAVLQKAYEQRIPGRDKRTFGSGPESASWRGGRPKGVYGVEWARDVRPARLRLDGYMCQDCSKEDATGASLDVHHVILRKLGGPDELWNLVSLCDRCHGRRPEHRDLAVYR